VNVCAQRDFEGLDVRRTPWIVFSNFKCAIPLGLNYLVPQCLGVTAGLS